MIHVTENEKLSKRSECQAKISTRKSIMTNHQCLSCDINKDFTDRNKYNVNRYSFMKADTKVDNKHKLSKIK